MTQATKQTSDELIAELNADLRARDPMQIMKRQMFVKSLAELRERVNQQRLANPEQAHAYLQLEEIIKDLERPGPVMR